MYNHSLVLSNVCCLVDSLIDINSDGVVDAFVVGETDVSLSLEK
jgi:hypothetical protein